MAAGLLQSKGSGLSPSGGVEFVATGRGCIWVKAVDFGKKGSKPRQQPQTTDTWRSMMDGVTLVGSPCRDITIYRIVFLFVNCRWNSRRLMSLDRLLNYLGRREEID